MKWLTAFLLPLCLLLAGMAHSAQNSGAISDDPVTVYIVRHRWHTGIVFPAERLEPSLYFLPQYFAAPRYYEFGWGDNQFYRQDDNLWLRARAMLWPTRGVLHVVGMHRHPAQLPHTDIQALCLSGEQLSRLQHSLAGYFELDQHGELGPGDPGLYGDSRFFLAHGRFWLGNTCNTWTARQLQQAGLPIRSFMTLTADQVLRQLRRGEQAGACPS